MQTASTSGSYLRWPLYEPEAPLEECPALFARPFGQPEDLDVDFRSVARPVVVTAVLARGLRRPDPESPVDEAELWRWPVTLRTQGLLAIAAATGGTGRQTTARCDNPDCGELMEIPLDLDLFRSAASEDSFHWQELELRLPTGEDQMRLTGDEVDSVALARSLIRSGDPAALNDQSLPDLETALEERDRLTDLELAAECPYCGLACRVEFDLEAFLLAELERRQIALLQTVHRLAAAFHWSENEILALPAWRRDYYLEALDQEALA